MELFISDSKLKKIDDQFKKDKKKFSFLLVIHFTIIIALLSLFILLGSNDNFEGPSIILFIVLILYLIFGAIGLAYIKYNFKSKHMLTDYALELLSLESKTLSKIDNNLKRNAKESIFLDRNDSVGVHEAFSFDIDGYEGKFYQVSATRSSGKSSYTVLSGIILQFNINDNNDYNSFLKYNSYSKKGFKNKKVNSHKKLYLFTTKDSPESYINNFEKVYEKLMDLNLCNEGGLYISPNLVEIVLNIKFKQVKIKKIDEETLKQVISYYETFYNIIKKNLLFIHDVLNNDINNDII